MWSQAFLHSVHKIIQGTIISGTVSVLPSVKATKRNLQNTTIMERVTTNKCVNEMAAFHMALDV